jgi:hypothetical protein
MALNPDCTPGRVVPDELALEPGRHRVFCGCGWEAGGFESKSAASRAQKAHRFPGPNPMDELRQQQAAS